jgi:uncharacterized protein (TIGR02145 family)
MKSIFSKLALTTGFVLAFVFILSCGEHEEGELWMLGSSSSEEISSSSSEPSSSSVSSSNVSSSGGSSSSGVEACEAHVSTEYCSAGTVKTYGTVSDAAGKAYKTIEIGKQVWMAENLNYDVPDNDSDVCYNNDDANCGKYGRLYNWATAMKIDASCNGTLISNCGATVFSKHQGICPRGWHIPSDADWNVLMKFVNPSCLSDDKLCRAGTKLKATSGWSPYIPAGTDDFGFAALPGGIGDSDGDFGNVGYYGSWWSASFYGYSFNGSYFRGMGYNSSYVTYTSRERSMLLSVRCVKN